MSFFRIRWLLIFLLLFMPPVYGAWQGEQLLELTGLQQPSAVAVSDTGDIYVLDGVTNQIVVFSDSGKLLRRIHIPTKLPMDLLIADNKIMLADTGNHRLLVLSLAGQLLQTITLPAVANTKNMQKKGGVGISSVASNKAEPTGISYQKDTIYWSDRRNQRVCKTTLTKLELGNNDDKQTNCWGNYGKADNQFRYPFMIASDKDNYLYVVDVLNARIQIFNYRGKFFGTISGFGLSSGTLFRPNGITIDESGNLFVSDSYKGTISSFKGRKFTGKLLNSHAEILKLGQIIGLHYKDNKLYIAEAGNSADRTKNGRVLVFQLKQTTAKPDALTSSNKDLAKTSRQDCVMCHIEWGNNKNAITNPKLPPVAEQKMCLSCHHGAVIDSRLSIMQGGQHPDYHHPVPDKDKTSQRKTPINKNLPILDGDTPYCGSCHTPHATHENETGIHPAHQNSWMREDNSQGKLCESCHQDHKWEINKAGINHPVGIHLQKPPHKGDTGYTSNIKLHKGLPKTLLNLGGKTANKQAMSCESCHLVHGSKGKSLLLEKKNELCSDCHAKQTSVSKKSAHKKGIHPVNVKPKNKMTLKHKKVEKVECQSCHDVHGGMLNSALLHTAKTPDERCEDCHSRQYSSNKKQAHSKGIHPIHEKLDKTVKLAGKAIKQVECQSCHSVHDGIKNTSALVINEKQLCITCHARQNNQGRKEARKKGVHPLNLKLKKTVKIAAKSIHSVECKSCHSVHNGKKNTASLAIYEKQLCATCHARQNNKGRKDARRKGVHPVNLKLKKNVIIAGKNIQRLECQSCHSVHKGKKYTPSLVQNEKQLCANCHPAQTANNKQQAHKKGIHPVNFTLKQALKFNNKTIRKIECQTCHSLHNGKENTPSLVKKDANQLCISCHPGQHANSIKQARRKGVHPVNIKLDKAVSIAGKKVKTLQCLSCHSVHHGKPNTPALVEEHNNGQLCKNCHQSESAVIYSDHNMQRTAKKSHNLNKQSPTDAGVCGSCHSMHKAPKGADRLFVGSGIGSLAKKVLKRDRSCFACHRDKGIAHEKQVKHYTHPQRDLVLKSNSKQFPLVDQYGNNKINGQIACITCHNPHRWMPAGGKHSAIRKGQNEEGNVLNSFLNAKSPQGMFCVNCHGIESQIRFKYYHDKRGRPGHAGYIR